MQQVVPDFGTTSSRKLAEVFVIYDADGTVAGELLYIVKKWFGRGHCAACVITHGPKREKPEFTSWKEQLGVSLHNIHRDEMDIDLYNATRGRPFPCVVARDVDGEYVYVMTPEELEKCEGQVYRFEHHLVSKLSEAGFATEEVLERSASDPLAYKRRPSAALQSAQSPVSDACLVPEQ
mmetsp:Transcript_15112/g.40521  ORF Transcript_15112/g.40521 Transcript_15112/m.40521 type:complete len:179 (-) Transcript_15112:240-776(-)